MFQDRVKLAQKYFPEILKKYANIYFSAVAQILLIFTLN